jgi:DNA-3-methyladenine glycosylase II
MITETSLSKGLRFLAKRDRDLARILKDLGPPPIWAREPGFPTLIHIILEQQVSLASARAAFDRLVKTASPLTPASFLGLGDATLKTIGFSRQKTNYGRHLAEAILQGNLSLDRIHLADDNNARAELLKLKGIGNWTIDIYLLMALGRPDIWPSGDLALAVAFQKIKGLASRPTPAELEEYSFNWRPWRAVAARLLWHYYLSDRASRGGGGN